MADTATMLTLMTGAVGGMIPLATKGIGIGDSQAEVVKAYGPPDPDVTTRAANEKPVSTETSMDHATISYRKLGLSFALFRGKVSRITIEAPRLDPIDRP